MYDLLKYFFIVVFIFGLAFVPIIRDWISMKFEISILFFSYLLLLLALLRLSLFLGIEIER